MIEYPEVTVGSILGEKCRKEHQIHKAQSDSISKRTRFEVFKRDNFQCLYCGRIPPEVVLQIDHLVARSNGGTSDISNLVTACKDCNSGKSNIPLYEIPRCHVRSLEEREEKLEQLQAIAEQAQENLQIQDSIVVIVSDHWIRREGGNSNEFMVGKSIEASIRRFSKLLPLRELLDAVQITFDRVGNKSDYDRHKYFCGVCWSKIKSRDKERLE